MLGREGFIISRWDNQELKSGVDCFIFLLMAYTNNNDFTMMLQTQNQVYLSVQDHTVLIFNHILLHFLCS